MKNFYKLFFLIIFFFSTNVYSEKLEGFEIEGASIGQSLLEYFSKEEIIKIMNDPNTENYKKDYYITSLKKTKSLSNYDEIFAIFKKSKKFKIYGIIGQKKHYSNDKCVKKAQEFLDDVTPIFFNKNLKMNYNEVRYNIGEALIRLEKSGDFILCYCNDRYLNISFMEKRLGLFFIQNSK
jgi:hypothetical protein